MRIGIFDSGYGGLTVYHAIKKRLPDYDYLYLGDNARTPYGDRPVEEVISYATEGIRCLLSNSCSLVIVACTTASSEALRDIQQQLLPAEFPDRRVLGIIIPSVEALAERFDQEKRVALWATAGTVRSGTFDEELAKLANPPRLTSLACPRLVPLIEEGDVAPSELSGAVHDYWRETIRKSPDLAGLLLACTHYPLIEPLIRKIVPPEVEIVTQGPAVATKLADYLHRHPEIETTLTKEGREQFLTTADTSRFTDLSSLFLGRPISAEHIAVY